MRRRELVALRWRDMDFPCSVVPIRASYSAGGLTSPKHGKVRSVPMAPQVAGTRAISKADILRVKEWIGHADVPRR